MRGFLVCAGLAAGSTGLMADVVRSVERDLRRRLVEIERELAGFEQLAAERSRIEAALARLDGQSDSAKRSRKSSGRRAPRGANQARILAVVDERPGVSAADVAGTTGIGSGTVGSTLAKL